MVHGIALGFGFAVGMFAAVVMMLMADRVLEAVERAIRERATRPTVVPGVPIQPESDIDHN